MNLNRKASPATERISALQFPLFDYAILKNGIQIYSHSCGIEPVLKLDFVFNAGLAAQAGRGIATMTAQMLSEGTKHRTGKELNELLDYYGAYTHAKASEDDLVVSLYCLEKHLSSALPLFLEAVLESIFPVNELETLKQNSIQKLKVNERKNSFIARRIFTEKVWGNHHPYSQYNTEAGILAITRQSLIEHHDRYILNNLSYIILSGLFQENTLAYVKTQLSETQFKSGNQKTFSLPVPNDFGKFIFEGNRSGQTSFRLGKQTISRLNEDFRQLQLLNMLLGGFFGSRLMKNIREDKGYTYGIYSGIETQKLGSVWVIECEMKDSYVEDALHQINKEINLLKTALVSSEELETVKNYYLGSFLKSLDGPFSLAARQKIMIDYNLPQGYYDDLVSKIYATSSEKILLLANKYFNENNLVEVIVGKM